MAIDLDLDGSAGPTRVGSGVVYVSLDGAYLRTDVFHEALVRAVRRDLRVLLLLPFWWLQGRDHLRRAVAAAAGGMVEETAPRTPEVEHFVRAARAQGRRVELVDIGGRAAGHGAVGDGFDAVLSMPHGKAAGDARAALLRRRHPEGFAYVGQGAHDLPVWRAATERYAANLAASARRRAAHERLGLVELTRRRPVWGGLLRAIRPHHAAKNLLMLVPLVFAISDVGWSDVGRLVLAFLLFSLLTGGTYVLNDVLDHEADRRHPRKRQRPIARGDLPMSVAIVAASALCALPLVAAAVLDPGFVTVLAGYLVLTLAYSVRLKRVPFLDVAVVGLLFALRIVAGMVLLGEPVSLVLVAFSVQFFTGLALIKRVAEDAGRGSYAAIPRGWMIGCGVAASAASLLLLALFIGDVVAEQPGDYPAPALLWVAPAAVGVWLARMWRRGAGGRIAGDPLVFALRDTASLVLGALTLGLVCAAQIVRF